MKGATLPLDAAAEAFIATTNKLLKEELLVSADKLAVPRRFTTGSISADVILGGGLPGNQWTEILGKKSAGKALDITTPIPSPDGWTTMEKLQPGDRVFDENGMPCRITFVTGVQNGRDCFEVRFRDGSALVADADHQWTVLERQKGGRIVERTVTTSGMLTEGLRVLRDKQYKFHIPTTMPLEYPEQEQDLPVPPYVLGAWLGDGTSVSGGFTSADEDVVESIRSEGYEVRRRPGGGPYAWGILGLMPALRELGVLGNKHIPVQYLQAPIMERLDLLRGLMDTDGSTDKRGHCEFTTVFPTLADEVYELLVSLGIKAHRGEGRATLNGRWISQKYRLTFTSEFPVFRLPRKLSRQQAVPQHQFTVQRTIVSITPVESVPVKCITVDSPRSLYLAGRDMIPTHNTFFAHKTVAANQHDDPSFTTLWVASESYNTEWASALGVDNTRVVAVPTQKMEVALQIMLEATSSQQFDCIVLDSYPALVVSEEDEKAMDEFTTAAGARTLGKWTRKAGDSSRRAYDGSDRPFIGLIVNQWRDKIGGFAKFGTPQTSPGGNGKDYFFYAQLDIARKEFITEKRAGIKEPVAVGQVNTIKTIKNKSAAPQQRIELPLYFRRAPFLGFDRGDYDTALEYFSMGKLLRIISQSGSYYSFGGQRWQGEDKTMAAIREDKDLQLALRAEVLEAAADPRRLDSFEVA
jgi:recombination protein RecA